MRGVGNVEFLTAPKGARNGDGADDEAAGVAGGAQSDDDIAF